MTPAPSPAPIHVIGGGLAGSEAAWQIASVGVPVVLHEMRPVRATDAHRGDGLAELVCSNSFRSDDAENNAVGVLHREMRRMGSLILSAADAHQVPAGGALAGRPRGVFGRGDARDRGPSPHRAAPRGSFRPAAVGLGQHHHCDGAADGALARRRDWRADRRGRPRFFRRYRPPSCIAIPSTCRRRGSSRATTRPALAAPAPTTSIVRSRTSKYEAFIDALLAAECTTSAHDADTPYFNGCLPIEIMAQRGRETLRHGPDEAGRAHQFARSHAQAARRRAVAPGQRARNALQYGRPSKRR